MALFVKAGPKLRDCRALAKPSIWDLGNSVLYDLCAKHPGHRTSQEVVAKVWLIGRSYAASVERRTSSRMPSEAFYANVVAPAVLHSALDDDLAMIHPSRHCVTAEDAELALRVHKNLMDTFCRASGRKNRSLASKHLHFRRPLFVPILESRANQEIRRFVRGAMPSAFPVGDAEYRAFGARFIVLRAWIAAEYDLELTPRQIDKLLLAY
jgi:hypothetical protein